MLAVCSVDETSPGNEFKSRLNKVFEAEPKDSPQTGGKTPSTKIAVANLPDGTTPAPAESSAPKATRNTPITPATPASVPGALKEADAMLATVEATLKQLSPEAGNMDLPSSEKGPWTRAEENPVYVEHPTPRKDGEGPSSARSTPARAALGRRDSLLATPNGTSSNNTPRSARSQGSARKKVEADIFPRSFSVSEISENEAKGALKTAATPAAGAKPDTKRKLIPDTTALTVKKKSSNALPVVLFLALFAIAAVFGAGLVLPPSSPPLSMLPSTWQQSVLESPVYRKLSKHATPPYQKAASWADPYIQKLSTWVDPYYKQASAAIDPYYQQTSNWIIEFAKQYNITLVAPEIPEPVVVPTPLLEEPVEAVPIPTTTAAVPAVVPAPVPVPAPKTVPSPTPVATKPVPAPQPATKPVVSETPKKKSPVPVAAKDTKKKQPAPQKGKGKSIFTFWQSKPAKKSSLLERLDVSVEVLYAGGAAVGIVFVAVVRMLWNRGTGKAIEIVGPSTAPVIGGVYLEEEEEEEAGDGPTTRGGRRGASTRKLPRINTHPPSGRLVSTYDAEDDSPGGRAWRREAPRR